MRLLDTLKKKEPEFTEDWLTAVAPVWDNLFKSLKNQEDLKYLEVGVFEGRSLIWMLQNIFNHSSSNAVAIDTFFECPREKLVENLRRAKVLERIDLVEGNSRDALKKMEPAQFDLIYIDADHRARGAMADLILSWDLLRIGGYLIFDDYNIHSSINPVEASVMIGADCFLTAFQNELRLVFHDQVRQFIVQKEKPHKDNYITQSGPFYFNWGTGPKDRVVIDSRTDLKVEMSDTDINSLAQALLDRPLGQIHVDEKSLPEELRVRLKTKVPDFFQKPATILELDGVVL